MLSHQDILSCHRVCRIWNQAFFPSFLWESFRIQAPSIIQILSGRYPKPDIIQRNASHIRKLVCQDIRIIQYLIPECCHLEELDVHGIGTQVPTLLRQNAQSLKKVSLSVSIEHRSMKGILRALTECVHVEQCELRPAIVPIHQLAVVDDEDDEDDEDMDEANIIQEFYRVVRDIPHLKISCTGIKKPPAPVLEPEDSSLSDLTTTASSMEDRRYESPNFIPQLPKLQSLNLNESKMSFMNQVRLLQHCQLELVDLTWKFVSMGDQSIQLVDTLHFQLLKLTTLCMERSVLKDRDMAMILMAMPSLVRVRLQKTQIGMLSMAVIVGHAPPPLLLGHGVVLPTSSQDLSSQGLRNHLVELDIRDCPAVESQAILKVLQTCWKLKVLKAPRIAALDIVQQSHFWVCLGLEELHVGIIQVDRLGGYDGQRRIMHQIGQLTMLQTLSIRTNLSMRNDYWGQRSTLYFTMDSGLDELWNLKELKVFAVEHMCHNAEMKELQWVKENWAKYQLREVTGMRRPRVVTASQWDEMKAYTDKEMPHVTFKDERPKEVRGWITQDDVPWLVHMHKLGLGPYDRQLLNQAVKRHPECDVTHGFLARENEQNGTPSHHPFNP
ncbi:MAG: hypothetical protein J3Q66DRAFT_363070 [Benniella sp.]|nr:MAG: hypothetical protein J3Q66DRAFT_363070 [Benniella sp.]